MEVSGILARLSLLDAAQCESNHMCMKSRNFGFVRNSRSCFCTSDQIFSKKS
jgi:hypothetical protein